jgi:UPF0755 protein
VDQATRPVIDMGWDDFAPSTPEDVAEGRPPASLDVRRDYRSGRSSGPGQVLRFAVFTLLLGGLVVGGLYFVARPIVVGSIVDWASENPTALKLPFVADVVRNELGSSLTQPVDARDQNPIAIIIGPNETPRQIGDQLVKAGAITEARALVFQAIERGATSDFQIGRHVVSKSQTVDEMISILTQPPVAPPTVRVTFREGLRIEQMVAKLESVEANPTDPALTLKLDVNLYYQLATNPTPDLLARYPWLKLPAGASLEGFLFPATYDVAPDTSALQLIEQQLDAFAANAPAALLVLPPDQIYQTVQVASMVESEVKLDTDRPLVAGVFANRLDRKKWPTGLLESDPTVNYANDSVWLASHPISSWVDYTFWTPVTGSTPLAKIVFPEKIAPYNTYAHGGLPPTPICSPGLASLEGAVAPDTQDGYYYFLAKNDGTGALAFAKTSAEQTANEKKYGYLP